MATTKTAEVLLKYKVDASSANRVSDSFEDLIAEINELNAELTKIGRASSTGVAGITRELPKAESGIVALQDEVIRLRKELLALDDVDVSPTVTVQSGAGRIGGGGVGALNTVDRFGAIGSQIGSGLGNGAVGGAAGLIGDVAGSIATLNPFLIAGAVAIGGVSLAMQDLTNKADAARAAAEAQIAGSEAAIAQTGASFTQQQARIDAIISTIAAAEERIDRRKAEIAQNDAIFAEARAAFWIRGQGDLVQLTNLGNTLTAASDALRADVTATSASVSELSAELIPLSANVQRLTPLVSALQTVTTAFAPVLTEIVAGFTELADKARSLPGELATAGAAEAARKAAAAQLALDTQTERSSKLFDSVNATVKAQEALIGAQNAYNTAVEASRQRITELNTKLQSDITSAGDERRTALLEAERDAGDQRVKITEDSAREQERIQRRFTRSYEQAVGDRDALAAARAEQQRDDELKDLNERYKDQNKALDDNLAKQQRTIEQRYAAQVQTARSAADAAIRLEQQRAQAEINVKAQAVQAAQIAMVNAQQAEYLIRANFYNQSITQAVAWANQMAYLTAYGFTIPAGSTAKSPVIIGKKAAGGPVGAGMPYIVGERGPEMFVPSVSGTVMPNRGGAMFTVNFEGATGGTIRATSKAQAIAVLDKVLTGMGAA